MCKLIMRLKLIIKCYYNISVSSGRGVSSGVMTVSSDGYARKLRWICPKVAVDMSVSSGRYVCK